MTKRILQIVPTLDRAGTQQQMSLLARGLPREEFNVHVCSLGRGGPLAGELEDAGIPVKVLDKRWPVDPVAFRKLHRLVARLRPDLIHAWLFETGAYGHAVSRACGIKQFMVSRRGIAPRKNLAVAAVDRHVCQRSAAVIVNNEAVRDFTIANGLPPEKIRLIRDGIRPIESDGTTHRQLLDELGLPESSRLIGLIARLLPRRRIKDAIWSVDLLKVVRDDVHLLIIGDGPHRDRLRKFRDQVEIRDKVHFLGQRNDTARILPHLDLFLSTSGLGGQTSAVMEAMAAGLPVVSTDTVAARSLVQHEETGYLVPVGSRVEIAKHANYLLDDPERAERFGQAARQRMLDDFSAEAMIGEYTRLYRETL